MLHFLGLSFVCFLVRLPLLQTVLLPAENGGSGYAWLLGTLCAECAMTVPGIVLMASRSVILMQCLFVAYCLDFSSSGN